MRTHATDAERILWRHLRGGRLNGYKFRRQVVIEPYIVDFVCLGAKLIIEADGGQHGEQEVYDRHRTQKLESMGYTVMRFWNHDILKQTDSVLEMILTRLMKSSPLPGPLPGGEGEGRRGGKG
ncbi:MAG: endonuclease domain-containing protein [Pseudomonadota bacterium]